MRTQPSDSKSLSDRKDTRLMKITFLLMKITSLLLVALSLARAGLADAPPAADFRSDVALMKQHTDVVVLSDRAGKAEVAVVPAYQGRVMTSTSGGGRRRELRMDQQDADRVREDAAAHQCLRRRGPYLVWAGGRAVRPVLPAGRPVRLCPLADAGPGRHRGLEHHEALLRRRILPQSRHRNQLERNPFSFPR